MSQLINELSDTGISISNAKKLTKNTYLSIVKGSRVLLVLTAISFVFLTVYLW